MVFDKHKTYIIPITKDYKIGICCNSKEQKEAWNPNNVFLSVAICQPTELALKYLTW